MGINVWQVNNQVRQLNNQAAESRHVQTALLSYQHNLNSHWRGEEMIPTNQEIDDNARRLDTVASDLESISRDILAVAEMIKMNEVSP